MYLDVYPFFSFSQVERVVIVMYMTMVAKIARK